MSEELSVKRLLDTQTLSLRDIVCCGGCRHKSAEECASSTYFVFPYRGAYVRHLGRDEAVAEANQVLFFNQGESYQVSHPVTGGDACLSLVVGEPWLNEVVPKDYLRGATTFNRQRLRIDARAQSLVALLRYSLRRGVIEPLEAETLVLTLLRRSLGERAATASKASAARQKLVNRAKLILTTDLRRRWTLADIASEVGVSPVYLTQLFQQVEGMPLYRYQLRLRLSHALELLDQCQDLTALGLELGFSSHSHFSSAFRQVYGRTPSGFQSLIGSGTRSSDWKI
jgi:AraC-like DNA-binding protein